MAETAPEVVWRMHLRSAPERVYEALSTDAGRATFWAESAVETDGVIDFRFANGFEWAGTILETDPPRRYVVDYVDHSRTTFTLDLAPGGGTDLTVTDREVPARYHLEVHAGWVSVLLTLKAAVDFGVDLRNHDPGRTWDQGYVDN